MANGCWITSRRQLQSIQRYTRSAQAGGKTLKTPFIVSGCGGHGGQAVAKAPGAAGSDTTFDFSYKGWGYTKATIAGSSLIITSYGR
jgi:hypothetical protein